MSVRLRVPAAGMFAGEMNSTLRSPVSGNLANLADVIHHSAWLAQDKRLSGVDVAGIVKKLATRAELDAARYAGHFTAGGTCCKRSDYRGVGTLDHGSDWASLDSDGTAVYTRWQFV